MKTYKEYIQLNHTNEDSLDENFKTIAGIGLAAKSRNVNSRLKQIVIKPTDSTMIQIEKLSKKIDLLSDQILVATYNQTTLGVMK